MPPPSNRMVLNALHPQLPPSLRLPAGQPLALAIPAATFTSQMGALLCSSAPLRISLPPLGVSKARAHA